MDSQLMAKLVLADITNPNNQTSIAATINSNNQLIEDAMENALFIDGTEPDEMVATLDMNGNRIINLPEPETDTEPVRLGDLEEYLTVDGAVVSLDDLSDVVISSVADNDFLRYDAGTERWVNDAGGGGGGGAPDSASYVVRGTTGLLSNEYVLGDSTSILMEWGFPSAVFPYRAALTGDVTAAANSNATTIADDAVTYAKMQNVSTTDRLLGRDTVGAGNVEELTVT